MVENFAYLIDSLGFIPNGTRDYYLSRSQPPFFSLMVDAISRENATQRVRFLPQMLAEYSFWMQKDSVTEQWGSSEASRYRVDLTDGFTLNRYWDSGTTPRPESFRGGYGVGRNGTGDRAKSTTVQGLEGSGMLGLGISVRDGTVPRANFLQRKPHESCRSI